MDINALYSTSSSTKSSTTKNSSNNYDKNMFLKILMAQLSNQDPMNSQDPSQSISQLAQFSALEQSQNMNASLEKMLVSQRVTEGSMMIGKNVAFIVSEDKYVEETVKGLVIEMGKVYLKTDKGIYDIDQVIGVGELKNDEQGGTVIED